MPSNEWFAGKSESDRGNIITRGRLFVEEESNIFNLFNIRIEVQWAYKGEKDGMPSAHETDVIDRIMILLTESLEKSNIAILTAIHIGGGQAVYVYYSQEIEAFSERVNELLGRLPVLPVKIGAEEDPEWSDYKSLLKKFGIDH